MSCLGCVANRGYSFVHVSPQRASARAYDSSTAVGAANECVSCSQAFGGPRKYLAQTFYNVFSYLQVFYILPGTPRRQTPLLLRRPKHFLAPDTGTGAAGTGPVGSAAVISLTVVRMGGNEELCPDLSCGVVDKSASSLQPIVHNMPLL